MAKRSSELFEFIVQIASNINAAAKEFEENLKDLSHPETLYPKIKSHEVKGDELVSSLVTLVNSTYITPIDREDFVEMAIKMDDVVDGLEACSVRFDLFNVTESTSVMLELAHTTVEQTEEILLAMQLLRDKKLPAIRKHTQKINQLEKVGDALLRKGLRVLFAEKTTDPLEVIKLKEIYEILERVTDVCQDVADALDSVIVKNA